MVNKNQILGYGFSGLGIIGILLSNETAKNLIPVIQNLSANLILIIGIILTIIGIIILFLTSKKRKSKLKEVPIYEGKEIVGYRKVK